MKDHNDFFDEMIDVDDEGEEFVGEEAEYDDDDDDDDDPAVVRTAVLRKNDMLALLSLRSSNDGGGQIVRVDPRERLPSMQNYDSEDEALKWYTRSLATSRKNGWAVVYDGLPLIG
ncbi:MAG: hypothetical protein QOJ70_3754 [Acidobacteriota bacterium]|jgi:hypothetical protein|nr:hypothetical protein [Acidobacteriota bacterium]MDT7809941.1 hypothetical protein [Acidobacteriota bacterium]